MTDLPQKSLRLNDLSNRSETPFALQPDTEEMAAMARALGITDLRKMRFEGAVSPAGDRDWALSAQLGATVVQPCVVTLAPVTTRIEERVARRFVAHFEEPEGQEVEMPEDETLEPLPTSIDLYAIALEALSLALPAYPRAETAELDQTAFAAPGVRPMTDEDARPFAGLAGLKDQLAQKGEDGDD